MHDAIILEIPPRLRFDPFTNINLEKSRINFESNQEEMNEIALPSAPFLDRLTIHRDGHRGETPCLDSILFLLLDSLFQITGYRESREKRKRCHFSCAQPFSNMYDGA